MQCLILKNLKHNNSGKKIVSNHRIILFYWSINLVFKQKAHIDCACCIHDDFVTPTSQNKINQLYFILGEVCY